MNVISLKRVWKLRFGQLVAMINEWEPQSKKSFSFMRQQVSKISDSQAWRFTSVLYSTPRVVELVERWSAKNASLNNTSTAAIQAWQGGPHGALAAAHGSTSLFFASFTFENLWETQIFRAKSVDDQDRQSCLLSRLPASQNNLAKQPCESSSHT